MSPEAHLWPCVVGVAIHCAAVDRYAAVDRCAAVDRSAEAGRYVVVGRYVAADHFVALVGIRVVLNVARSVAPNVALNAVRRFSWGDFRSEAQAVALVAARVVAQVVIPETTQA